MNLADKYRPTCFEDVVGQPAAVKTLEALVARKSSERPHTLALTGPSGCGKTTLARIYAKTIGIVGGDFVEHNAAASRGIDTIRKIQLGMRGAALFGRFRMYLVDKAHGLTKDAQTALLKTLEDVPRHVYFILATTDYAKLLPTIKTRATQVDVKPVQDGDMKVLLKRVAAAEGFKLGPEATAKVLALADGSPRHALVLLDKCKELTDDDEQVAAIGDKGTETAAFALAQMLMRSGTTWPAMAKALKECQELTNDSAEGLRHMVLSYATTCLLGGENPRAYAMHEAFSRNLYDTNRHGFIAACYRVIKGAKG